MKKTQWLEKNPAVDDLILDRPYKLCDYKVMYGEIFRDYLTGYDFWGYCDMDMLWGNIRKYFTDELLNSYGIISFFYRTIKRSCDT